MDGLGNALKGSLCILKHKPSISKDIVIIYISALVTNTLIIHFVPQYIVLICSTSIGIMAVFPNAMNNLYAHQLIVN